MALTLAPGIMANTFAQLRSCGQGRSECVVYWTGPRSVPGAVDSVVQPVHQAGPDWDGGRPDRNLAGTAQRVQEPQDHPEGQVDLRGLRRRLEGAAIRASGAWSVS